MKKRKMKTAFLSFVVFALLASTFVSPGTVHVHAADEAEVLIAPAPQGEVLSTDQTVTVNGQSVPVYRALGWANSNYSFAYFDFNGTVDVEVTDGSGRSAAGAVILPHSRGIEPTRSGSTLSFSLSEPAYVSIEFGGKNKPLLLFANALEEDAPSPGDPNVIYFGPGLHTPADVGNNGLIHLKSNETLYLAPGAIVQASIIARGDNISIKGRGILDGNAWPEKQGPTGTGPNGTGSETAGHVISARSSNHFTVEGIIIRGSWHWTIHARQSTDILIDNVKQANGRFYGDDGFDPVNSTGIIVRNSFFRNVDDNIAVKGQHAQPDGSYLPVGDMVVENNTFWSDIARNILIGDESSTPEFRNITYRNNDIIHFAQPSFRLRPGKEAVIRNILFENIRIHGVGTTGERFIELTPDINEWMTDPKTPGFIDGVTFKNIFLYGEGNEQYGEGSVLVKGYDETHTVKNVVFDNVYRYGRLLKENSLNLQVGPHVENITFTSSEPVTPPYPSNPPQVGWSASAGYSSIQGLNGWYYQQRIGGVLQDLTYGDSWSGTAGVYINKAKVHPGNTAGNEVVRKWVAPEDLLVRISGRVSKADTSAGDGVMTSISKNDEVLWTTDLQYDDNIGKTFDVYTSVAAGDALYFTVNMKTANNWADATNFDPFIAIVDEIPPVEVAPSWTASTDYVFAQGQGYRNWYYLLLKDGVYSDHPAGSTQWWSSDGSYINGAKMHPGGNSDAVVRKWSAPSAMAVQVTGNVAKASDALSSEGDGVTVSIKKNDEIVWGPQAVAYDDSVGYAYDFPVSLAAGDALYFIVNKNTTHYHDATLFNPTITFLSEPPVWPQGSNLIAEAASSSIKLTWPAATDDKGVTAYRIYRDGALVGTVAGTARTYTVTGLDSLTAYSFHVQAGDDHGSWTVDGPAKSATTLAQATVWKASTDFSIIQGLNNWYYYSVKDGVYSPHLAGTSVFVDANGSYVDGGKFHPGADTDNARKWQAPSSMKVRVTGDAKKADTGGGDGVIVSIVKNAETPNAETLWGPQFIAYNNSTGFTYDFETEVAAGEGLYFMVSRGATAESTHANDATFFDPTITFLSLISNPDPEPEPVSPVAVLNVNASEREAGQELELTVGAEDATAFTASDVIFHYDPEVLEFETEQVGNTFMLTDTVLTTEHDGYGVSGAVRADLGEIKILLFTADNGRPLAGTLPLFKLRAKVKENAQAGQSTTVSLSDFVLSFEGEAQLLNTDQAAVSIGILAKPEVVDKAELNATIVNAKAVLGRAAVGSSPGQYSQTAYNALDDAIELAEDVRDLENVTQSAVDEARDALNGAVQQFLNAVIPSPTSEPTDFSRLSAKIAQAQKLYNESSFGSKIGQYPVSAKQALKPALDVAIAVRNNSSSSQESVNSAEAALNEALSTFSATIVTLVAGSTKVSIHDLTIIAKYFGITDTHADWSKVAAADINDRYEITIETLAAVARMILDEWAAGE
jgi:hypothetical protein